MMLKKEREVIFLLEKHLEEVKESLKASSEALRCYLSDDLEKFNSLHSSTNVNGAFLEAGQQEIWHRLCDGAYFPITRGDLFEIVKSVGRIVNAAALSYETFMYLQPQIPIKIKNQLVIMTQLVFFLFQPIHESILHYLRGDDVLKVIEKNVDQFLQKRAEVIALSSDLKNQIYSSSLDHWQKSHLNDCMESITNISSQTAETNDKIQLIIVKIAS